MPLFFFSHERNPTESLVHRFYDELCDEVIQHASRRLTPATVGYIDNEADAHRADWPPQRLASLQSCRAFVALCSPLYFQNPVCGKEWGFFQQRLTARPVTQRNVAALFPIMWLNSELPPIAMSFNFDDPLFSAVYRQRGLRDLMRFRRYRDDYLEFVTAVARRIAPLVRQPKPPELSVPPPLAKAWDAFAEPQPAARSGRGRPSTFPQLKLDES
jgi:hypothetical protein